jgi:hypothetical protein
MDYTIYPYEGVGPIRLGMTMQQVHGILGEPERTLVKKGNVGVYTDDYYSLGLHVLYSESGHCNEIALFLPATPNLHSLELLGSQAFNEFYEWFRHRDENLDVDEDGLTSFLYGVALFAPDANEPVKKVHVFERGHYDGVADKIEAFRVELDRRLAAGLPIDDLL